VPKLIQSRISLHDLPGMLSGLAELCSQVSPRLNRRSILQRASGTERTTQLLVRFGLAVRSESGAAQHQQTYGSRNGRGKVRLVPTEDGVAFLQMLAAIVSTTRVGVSAALPCWDASRRELRVGSEVVTRFHRPATNQELLLQAFQEDGWPSEIDDPLPPHLGAVPLSRLRETVKSLNRRMQNRSIAFGTSAASQRATWHWRP
jgi:hypothetical protein